TCSPGRKFGTPIEKLMMSRPAALSCFALAAMTMIALGLARPTRWASWGMTSSGSWGTEAANPAILACGIAPPEAPAKACAVTIRGCMPVRAGGMMPPLPRLHCCARQEPQGGAASALSRGLHQPRMRTHGYALALGHHHRLHRRRHRQVHPRRQGLG